MEPFVASTHEVVNLWTAFFLEADRRSALETAGVAGFPENFSLWARFLYGFACEQRLEAVCYPKLSQRHEVLQVIERLAQAGVEPIPFEFPLFRNEERLRGQIDTLRRRLDVEPGVLEAVADQLLQVRTVLRRFDGLQQRTGAFASWDYVAMLARTMNPGRDFEGLRRTVEKGILDYRDLGRDRWTRIGILGMPPCRESLYQALEARKAVVVYDEWGVENNPMTSSLDLATVYHHCSLPYGLKRRQDRILRETSSRRIRGFILGVEYLCDSLRDEGFFRAALALPVLTVENRGGGPLTPAETRSLERFLDQVTGTP
jgi:hypothetical protein